MSQAMETHAQQQMRDAFYDGAPGVLVSGLVWTAAAVVTFAQGVERGIWTLLIGGMLIHPLAVGLTRALGRSAAPPRGNPLPALAGASTVWLIVCCAMAFVLSRQNTGWFFPAMMATIGARYLLFPTMYGRSLYWVCGGALILAACAAVALRLDAFPAAVLGGAIEVVFAAGLFRGAGVTPQSVWPS